MDKIDPFLTRYGAKPGRCNAMCKSGKPCHRWPIAGHKRCHRHGAGYTRPGRIKPIKHSVTGLYLSLADKEKMLNSVPDSTKPA